MILILGGTTEGRKAVDVLEEAGKPFYYSTKTGEQTVALHHGRRTDGAMDTELMTRFCREHGIRLLVDAAHPFARVLHQTVADVARRLELPLVRYERIYPERSDALTWIDDYREVPTDIRTLLATTGVQSISRLRWLEGHGVSVIYRILPRQSSVRLALEQGVGEQQLCYYRDDDDSLPDADAILLKESGLSGGFQSKVDAALARGMRVIVLRRPPLPWQHVSRQAHCNGPYGLRRAVERLLPDYFALHSGLTTGTCATAAAIAATRRLTTGQEPAEVSVTLPDGESIAVAVGYGDGYAYCTKEAGDDPDVTDGLEIRATVTPSDHFSIDGGQGVGRFTLPGFDYAPGEAAINRGPRQMMRTNIHHPVHITISVPRGEETAQRTFNPRLGIVGGISIIGVSGIVMPFSEEAFVASIRRCMQVARASGADRVVLNSGAKSERYVRQHYPQLPPQAFVEYGNYIGATLAMASELDFRHVTLGVMLGKAVKLAEGQLDTHSRRSTMNKDFVRQMLDEARCTADLSRLTLARELWDIIPKEKTDDFCRVVLHHCRQHCQPLVPQAELTLLLIADDGTIHSL